MQYSIPPAYAGVTRCSILDAKSEDNRRDAEDAEGKKGGSIKSYPSLRYLCDLRASAVKEQRAKSRSRGRSSMLYALCSVLCAIIITGCGEETPFEHQDSVPAETPGALTALHFPTADGCIWTYVSADGEHTYTAKIAGTRNVGGLAAKIMESDSDVPVSDLAWLYWVYGLYGFPIRTSLFTKDMDSYTEHALELWVDFWDDTLFQRNLPKRVLWSFPLYVGKEWIVSKSRIIPEITYTRKVVSGSGVLTVPAGTFEGVYYVEEYISIADLPTEEEVPNKYWLVPNVGVIKYEYVDYISITTKAYELSDFKRSR